MRRIAFVPQLHTISCPLCPLSWWFVCLLNGWTVIRGTRWESWASDHDDLWSCLFWLVAACCGGLWLPAICCGGLWLERGAKRKHSISGGSTLQFPYLQIHITRHVCETLCLKEGSNFTLTSISQIALTLTFQFIKYLVSILLNILIGVKAADKQSKNNTHPPPSHSFNLGLLKLWRTKTFATVSYIRFLNSWLSTKYIITTSNFSIYLIC